MGIQTLTENDRQLIYEILDLSFSGPYAHYSKMSFKDLDTALGMKEDGRLAGIINWRVFDAESQKLGYLFWLAVHPDFRRKGIGMTLMKGAIEKLQQTEGMAEIYASVSWDNNLSLALIGKLGFANVKKGILKRKYGQAGKNALRAMYVMPWEKLFMINSASNQK